MIFLHKCRWCVGAGLVMAALLPAVVRAQPGPPMWRDVALAERAAPVAALWVNPPKFRAVVFDRAALQSALRRVPLEATLALGAELTVIELPMPDGTEQRFRIVESPVMAPELAAKFPEIRTYAGQGVDDPAATVRLDLTPAGFHAQILSPYGAVYIDPQQRDQSVYASYYKRDYRRALEGGWQCLTASEPTAVPRVEATGDLARSGPTLRTYRLACAATGEYTQFHGGTVAAGMAAIVTAINRVTGIYETELAIRLQLVANNDLIVYTSPNSDPYSNSNPSSLLTQNQSNLDAVIGNANYDIGHVFNTGGGGLAGLGVVCATGGKARGQTGLPSPIGDPFYVDFVAHEMGHQFGANHTYNGAVSSCSGNRNASTAYEPGSGSTIMAYAGICGSDNLQSNSDPYFHSISFDEIRAFVSSGCGATTTTGNTAPTVSAGPNFVIPQSTPFTLTASSSDPNGDALTFCWEQRDLGPSTAVSAPDNGSSPLFRSFTPTADSTRTIPKLSALLDNTSSLGEILPTTSRTLNFRVTARDNRLGGGGVNTADMQVTVAASAGPFVVTSQNSGGVFSNVTLVTWNVADTTNAPINATTVNILLSTNGGQSFPITLLANTPNDGAQSVVLPDLHSTQARLKVVAVGNIFFDVNNANFTIVPGAPTPQVEWASTALVFEQCLPPNGAIDPGEIVTVEIALRNTGSAEITNLVATLLTADGVTSHGAAQNYGALLAGGPAVSRPFTFTATGACGGAINPRLQLQDGGVLLEDVSAVFALGEFATNVYAFTNAAPIAIPASGKSGPAAPYPSTITVAGVTGNVTKVTVTLAGLSHTWPDDIDVLLVSPTGQKLLLMSDCGGGTTLNNVTLTFDDAATQSLPDSSLITSGTYLPTNHDTTTDEFTSPAPGGPYASALSVFNSSDPNGNWALYIRDDQNPDDGSLAQGWRLNLSVAEGNCCEGVTQPVADLALAAEVSAEAINVGGKVTFTLAVTNYGPDTVTDVVVTSALPSELEVENAVMSQGVWFKSAGQVTLIVGTLLSGAGASVVLEATATAPGVWTNAITATSAALELDAANNVAAVAVWVNAPPAISAVEDQETNEDTPTAPIAFTVADPETSADLLVVTASSSDTNLVPVENITFGGSESNRTVTVLPGTKAFGSATITLTVSDGLASADTSFQLTVHPVNDPPELLPVPDVTLSEGELLVVTNVTFDVEGDELTFSLLDPPDHAIINETNGVFTWTPNETQGPGIYPITVVVTDDGVPSLSATQTFTVTVLESNQPPVLAAVADWTIHAGMTVQFTNIATDADLPANLLTFNLDAGAPDGSFADPSSGAFEWITSDADAGNTNTVTVRVTDDGDPPLEDARTFEIVVLPRPVILTMELTPEETVLTWTSIAGVGYQLQYTTNLPPAEWLEVLPGVTATAETTSSTNALNGDTELYYRVRVRP